MSRKKWTTIGCVIFLIALYAGITGYASHLAEKKVRQAIAEAAGFAHITYRNVRVDLFSMDVRISDIVVSPAGADMPVRIQELIIHDLDGQSDIPEFLSVTCRGMEVATKDIGAAAPQIMAWGYGDTVRFNLDLDYRYDPEKKELRITELGIGAEEAGQITLSLHLSHITLRANQMVGLLFTFPRVMVSEAQVIYQDDSLAHRVIKREAEKNETDTGTVHTAWIRAAEAERENATDDGVRNAWLGIREFLENPQSITISATPADPVSIGRIMQVSDPNDLIRVLDIHVRSHGA